MKEHAEAVTEGIIKLMESIEPESPVNITPEKREKLVKAVGDALGILDLILPPLIRSVMKEIKANTDAGSKAG